jgi:hypothetical protein
VGRVVRGVGQCGEYDLLSVVVECEWCGDELVAGEGLQQLLHVLGRFEFLGGGSDCEDEIAGRVLSFGVLHDDK